MATLTLRRHPATVYYFLYHHFFSKKLTPDLRVLGASMSDEPLVAGTIIHEIVHRSGRSNIPEPNFEQDITFESDDESLLCWISLALPEHWRE